MPQSSTIRLTGSCASQISLTFWSFWFPCSVPQYLSRINYKLINKRKKKRKSFWLCLFSRGTQFIQDHGVLISTFAAHCSGGEEENFRLIVFCSSNTNPLRLRDNAGSVKSSFPKNTVFDIYTTPRQGGIFKLSHSGPHFSKMWGFGLL